MQMLTTRMTSVLDGKQRDAPYNWVDQLSVGVAGVSKVWHYLRLKPNILP